MAELKVQSNILLSKKSAYIVKGEKGKNCVKSYTPVFGSVKSSDMSKKCWLHLRRLSEYMKNVSEFTNATIAAIGTGIIAPLVIMVSPGKGDKKDKDKKFFQAIRQPLSAGLALLFQVPATFAVNAIINKLAYKDKIKFFNDDTIGTLIPDKKYLSKKVTKEDIKELDAQFDKVRENGKSLHQELEERIRDEYKEVGLEISDDELSNRVYKDKKSFLREKIVEERHKKLLDTKFNELQSKGLEIKDSDLVTEDVRKLAQHKNKAEYELLEKNAKLNWFDKFISVMGFENSKTKALKAKQKQFEIEKGIEILKQDEPDLFRDATKKLKKFIEVKDGHAQKFFGNKKFWLALFINLFMVTASCYALNWAHPRTKVFIDKFNHKNDKCNLDKVSQQKSDNKKVEVKA